MWRFRLPLMAAVVALALAAPVSPAAAKALPTLNPPPPDFETCHVSGSQTICEGNQTETGTLEATGITCGDGPSSFEIYDHGGTVFQHAARWYDGNGNLTRRFIHETWRGSAWTNPLAGTAVRYTQSNNFTDVLAVPGDLGSVTETTTGEVNFLLPGSGAIVLNAGRTVFSFDGTLESRAGPQAFIDYFVDGDASALDPICAALS
jgi:hypothetical protein